MCHYHVFAGNSNDDVEQDHFIKEFATEGEAKEFMYELEGYKWKVVRFVPPTDPNVWWLNSHCANGTADLQEICWFCGETYEECFNCCTKSVKEKHELSCGGAGFKCSKCGKIYHQDTCGETSWAAEGLCELREDGYGYCECGQKLYKDEECEE